MSSHLSDRIAAAKAFMASPRFEGIVRLYSARDVAVQQGTIEQDYTVTK
jgi:isocitrate lyase